MNGTYTGQSSSWLAKDRSSLVRTVAPDFATDPLSVAYVRDEHLRGVNGSAEDAYIEKLIRASIGMAEHRTGRTLLTQTWAWSLSGFPGGCLELPLSPVQSVSIDYVDADGALQTLGGSPYPYLFVNPTVESNRPAFIAPLYGQVWPTTRAQREAVIITIVAGYPEVNAFATIPDEINQGRLLVIGELYKQRSESVHAFNQNPAMRGANNLWDNWRVFR